MAENKLNYRRLFQYLLFAVAVLWIALASQSWTDQKAGVRAVKDRTHMADLVFPQLNGSSWRLSDHRGEVVLINYWASWCGPCRQETPGLIDLARDYRYKGLSIVGVSMDMGGKPAVESFMSEFHLPYPVLLPDLASPSAPAIDALPTTVLVDRNGRAAKSYVGAVRSPSSEPMWIDCFQNRPRRRLLLRPPRPHSIGNRCHQRLNPIDLSVDKLEQFADENENG